MRGGLPGLTAPAKAQGNNPPKTSVWSLLFNDAMLSKVVRHTNQKLQTVRRTLGPNTSKSNYRDTDPLEINAYIGVQLLSSILKSSREDMTSMMSKDVTNRPFF